MRASRSRRVSSNFLKCTASVICFCVMPVLPRCRQFHNVTGAHGANLLHTSTGTGGQSAPKPPPSVHKVNINTRQDTWPLLKLTKNAQLPQNPRPNQTHTGGGGLSPPEHDQALPKRTRAFQQRLPNELHLCSASRVERRCAVVLTHPRCICGVRLRGRRPLTCRSLYSRDQPFKAHARAHTTQSYACREEGCSRSAACMGQHVGSGSDVVCDKS